MRGKDSGFNDGPLCPQIQRNLLIQPLGLVGRCRFVKTGAAAIRRPAKQGELRYQQHGSAHIDERPIHFPVLVGKNTQGSDLFYEIPAIRLAVAFRHAQQYEQPGPDLADNLTLSLNRRAGDSLKYGFHLKTQDHMADGL